MTRVRALVLFVGAVLGAPAAQAGPWLSQQVPGWNDGRAGVAIVLGSDGNGYCLTWDDPTNTARVHRIEHTLSSGPTLGAVDTFTALREPRLAFNGTTALASGRGDALLEVWESGAHQGTRSTNAWGSTNLSVALDRAGSARALALISGGGVLPNGARSTDAFLSAADVTVSTTSVVVDEGALWGTAAAVLSSSEAYWTTDVALGTWSSLATIPTGLSTNRVIAASATGAFLAAGVGGDALLLPSAAASWLDCSEAGSDIMAVTALETDFWLGRADGSVDVVDGSAGCWSGTHSSWDAVLDRVDDLAVREDRLALALGRQGGVVALAWRNRPPAAPTLVGGGDVDEGANVTVVATPHDPDLDAGGADEPAWAWSCDAALGATGTSSDTVSVTAPDLCVDAAAPGARTSYSCSVVATDTDAQASPAAAVNFAVLPADTSLPSVTGVTGLSDGASVVAGTPVNLTLVASDDCPHQADWAVLDDATDTVREQLLDEAWSTPFDFTAQTLGADLFTDYYLALRVNDTAGNSAELSSFTFRVGLPQPAPDVVLSCPASLEAGATGIATATLEASSGAVVSHEWTLAGATVDDTTPADATLSFVTDVCDGGASVTVGLLPHGVFEDGPPQQCTIALLEPAVPPAPELAIAEAPELVVTLAEEAAQLTLHASVVACADDAVSVRWDLAELPGALWPEGASADGSLTLGRGEPLALVVGPETFARILSTRPVLRAQAHNQSTDTRSDVVEVALLFRADAAMVARAGLTAAFESEDPSALPEWALLPVTATLVTDVAVSLPQLTLALVGDGLSVVPGSVSVKSDCGVAAAVESDGGDTRLALEGVSAACPAQLRFVARRGLGAGALSTTECAWGATRTPLARCEGSLVFRAPPALACGAAPLGPIELGGLVLLIGMRTVVRPRVRRNDTQRAAE